MLANCPSGWDKSKRVQVKPVFVFAVKSTQLALDSPEMLAFSLHLDFFVNLKFLFILFFKTKAYIVFLDIVFLLFDII